MLVNVAADPIDSWVIADGLVVGVDHDALIPDMSSVITDPVGIEHAEFTHFAPYSLLGIALEIAGGLLLLHTVVPRLAVHNALAAHLLAAAALDANSVDHNPLFGLVPQLPRLIWTCWT